MIHTREDDLLDLEILHLRENLGLSAASVGKRVGKSKGAIIGFQSRVKQQCGLHRCRCEKPENQDGALAAKWWQG